MATIAQLEAQIETLSRRNAELEQQLVQAQRLAEKAEDTRDAGRRRC